MRKERKGFKGEQSTSHKRTGQSEWVNPFAYPEPPCRLRSFIHVWAHAHNFSQTCCNGSTCPRGDSECELHNKYMNRILRTSWGILTGSSLLRSFICCKWVVYLIGFLPLITGRFHTLSSCYWISLTRAQRPDWKERALSHEHEKHANSQPRQNTGPGDPECPSPVHTASQTHVITGHVSELTPTFLPLILKWSG